MSEWSKTSEKRLSTCHVDLQILAEYVIEVHDCSIMEGHRGKKEQNQAYYIGNSKVKYPNSKHNSKPSMAMDIVPYQKGKDPYNRERILYFAGIVKAIAHMLYKNGTMQHKVRWGGDWDSDNDFQEHKFFDGAHWELVE